MKRIVAGLLLLSGTVVAQEAGKTSDAFYAAIRANELARLQSMLKSGSKWISAMGTGWATTALAMALPQSTVARR